MIMSLQLLKFVFCTNIISPHPAFGTREIFISWVGQGGAFHRKWILMALHWLHNGVHQYSGTLLFSYQLKMNIHINPLYNTVSFVLTKTHLIWQSVNMNNRHFSWVPSPFVQNVCNIINKTVSAAFFLRACLIQTIRQYRHCGMSHLCLYMVIMWVPLYFVFPHSVCCAFTTVK